MANREISVLSAPRSLLEVARQSFATRRVPVVECTTLVRGRVRPRSGDVVLAQVEALGSHQKLETKTGRRAAMHVGDLIVVAYGNRYATDQFESYVPDSLGRTHLVASGGIASTMATKSAGMRMPTRIRPVGLLGDHNGRPFNLADFAVSAPADSPSKPLTIAVLGTSMNSGKTTTIHWLVHSLARMGQRPGATKVTGTGSGGDYWVMLDAGAHNMLDFTDAGLASTYCTPMPVIEDALVRLTQTLTASGTSVNLVEIADGVFQQETSQIINSEVFKSVVDKVIFAAGDAMGAVTGVRTLREHGHDVIAVSGKLTASPLAAREAKHALQIPVLGLQELANCHTVAELLNLEWTGQASRFDLEPAWDEETSMAHQGVREQGAHAVEGVAAMVATASNPGTEAQVIDVRDQPVADKRPKPPPVGPNFNSLFGPPASPLGQGAG